MVRTRRRLHKENAVDYIRGSPECKSRVLSSEVAHCLTSPEEAKQCRYSGLQIKITLLLTLQIRTRKSYDFKICQDKHPPLQKVF
jgi:retron-type reverse transcriptase